MEQKPNQPTLTNKNIPQPGTGITTGGGQTPTKPLPLVARPLAGPEYTNVRWKNPQLSGRYILREDPGRNGSHLRYSQALAMGFRPATVDDAEVPGLTATNGHFINGDLILMCMPKEKYDSALLYKDQLARKKADPRNLTQATRNDIRFRNNPAYRVAVYQPGGPEAQDMGAPAEFIGPRADVPEPGA